MRSYSLLKTLVCPPNYRRFSSSLRKMSSEKNKGRNSKGGRRGSPSPRESYRLRAPNSHWVAVYPKDGPSSTVCVHPNKYSPTGDPSHGQMSQESAVDNKTHSQKHVPPCIEKNERETECKSPKDAIRLKSSEYSPICKGDMSQENSLADACGSNDCFISPMGGSQHEQDIHDNVTSVATLQPSEYSHHIFDICPQKKGVKLAPSFLVKNRELRKEHASGQDFLELRPGMILMKKYIRHSDQVEIIKTCRELGIGSGGFYKPGYSDGAKLRLWMMCLGKNWDPEGRKYEERRSKDNVKPPVITETFHKLVERAIQDAHAFIKKHSNVSSVEAVLPNMTPDVCIVNFYTDTGKLGLHQDQDESPESLHRGLPVVSFSLGDSAEFLYGDVRDADKANKVTLESGDVLIFGGKSRHIYHGVPSICSKTAPELLVNETNLQPGRLNLTFRQY